MPNTPRIVPSLIYRDSEAAAAWLERAFGFELAMMVRDKGKPVHIELAHGDALIYVGGDNWSDAIASPAALGGKNTAILSLAVDDVNAHYARAKAAGARILSEPEDQFYGDRTYRALDCEGHFWTFHQKVREVPLEEMERTSGHTIEIRK